MVGSSYTIVFKDGQVTAVEGTEQAIPKADTLDPAVADRAQKAIRRSEASESRPAGIQHMFPDVLLRKGEPWDRTETMDLGAGQTLTFQKQYEYLGTVEKAGRTLDKIGVKETTVSYAMEANPALPVSVSQSDLKVDSSDGTVLFDRELGRVVESHNKTHITGDLTLQANGMDIPAKLDLTLDTETEMVKPSK